MLKTLRAIHKGLWCNEEVWCLHYILPEKLQKGRVWEGDLVDNLTELDKWWWGRFDKLIGELEDDPETRDQRHRAQLNYRHQRQ